jgi:tetratricopeptide (TPR) repeat protein
MNDPKAKKTFYGALEDFNHNNHMAAVNKLKKLLTPSATAADRFAIYTFLGIILEDVHSWQEAIRFYQMAMECRTHKTVIANLAFCYDRGGYPDTAIDTYRWAIELAPDDPLPSNNLAVLYLGQGKYEEALEYAHTALRINGNYKAALTTVAIANAMLGNTREYEEYYRRAVAHGADGEGIKAFIRNLQSDLGNPQV